MSSELGYSVKYRTITRLYYINKEEKEYGYFTKFHPLPERYRVYDMDETKEDDQLDGMLRYEKII